MRVNTSKQWYEYEADLNRILSISVYPGTKNPKKFIVDLTINDSGSGEYHQYIYDKNNKPMEHSFLSLMAIINYICIAQKVRPCTYFMEEKL